jgi:hypothetical protein
VASIELLQSFVSFDLPSARVLIGAVAGLVAGIPAVGVILHPMARR